MGTGAAHLVEQCWHRFHPMGWLRIFLPKSAFSVGSLTVFITFPCAIACINICAHMIIQCTPGQSSKTESAQVALKVEMVIHAIYLAKNKRITSIKKETWKKKEWPAICQSHKVIQMGQGHCLLAMENITIRSCLVKDCRTGTQPVGNGKHNHQKLLGEGL